MASDPDLSVLARLAATVEARRSADPATSHTARLLAKGPEKCAEKFGEEAVEAIIEAVKGDRARLTSEAADALYHLLVMLAARDLSLSDVLAELSRREGVSGVTEKAARADTIRRAVSEGDIARCLALRTEVFIEEQAVPPDLEQDGLDDMAEHWIAIRGDETLGTARVVVRDGRAKIQRVAVRRAARGTGLGARLMRAILADLAPRRATGAEFGEIYLEAQTHALPFYERLGFVAEGAEFLDAGIPHRRMVHRSAS